MTQGTEAANYRGEQPTSPTLALAWASLNAKHLTPGQLRSIYGPFGIRRYADGSDLRPTDEIIRDSLCIVAQPEDETPRKSAYPTLAAELLALTSEVRGEGPRVVAELVLADLGWKLP